VVVGRPGMPVSSGPLDDVAMEWFELCDLEKAGQLFQSTTLRAQLRLEKVAKIQGEDTATKLGEMKPGAKTSFEAFLQTVNQLATSSGAEAEMQAELVAMIAEVKRLGPPPPETGDAVKDMNSYRRYHALDKALAFLLQSLVVEEPADPVQAMVDKLGKLPSLAELRETYKDVPYYGNVKLD